LVPNAGSNADDVVVWLDEAADRLGDINALKEYARDFEARNGSNPYSDFILKYGRFPSCEEAAGMGRMMNLRLKASDGSLQPKLTTADKAARKRFRDERRASRMRSENVRRLRQAVSDLAAIDASPSQLIEMLNSQTADAQTRDNLKCALDYLTRFAQQWRRHEARKYPGSS
jgi:hypothetical protein